MAFRWKDNQTSLFLEVYKNYECLWNNKVQDYHKVNMRENAYQSLLNELNFPGLTVADIKAKIKTIRTRYCSELAKIRKSEHTGAGKDDLYVPRLFWFKEADSFLRPVCTPRDSSSNLKNLNGNPNTPTEASQQLDDDEQEEKDVETNETKNEQNLTDTYDDIQQTQTNNTQTSISSTPTSAKRTKKRKADSNIEMVQGAIQKLQKLSDTNRKPQNMHEFDAFCNSLAIQLKKMPLERALVCQEKLQAVMTQERLSQILRSDTSRHTTSPSTAYASPTPSPGSVPEHSSQIVYTLDNYDSENYNSAYQEQGDVLTQAIYSISDL